MRAYPAIDPNRPAARRRPWRRAVRGGGEDAVSPLGVVVLTLQAVAFLYACIFYASGSRSDLAMYFAGGTLILSWVAHLVWLIKRGWVVLFTFLFFVIEPLAQAFFGVYINHATMIWKYLFPYELLVPTMKLAFVQGQFLMLAISFILLLPVAPRRSAPMLTVNVFGVVIAWLLMIVFGGYVVAVAVSHSRDEFMYAVAGQGRFLMTIGPLVMAMVIALAANARGFGLKPVAAIGAVFSLLAALSGYRSVLVTAGVALATGFLNRRKVTVPLILLAACGLVAAYFFMSYLSFLRSNHVTFASLLSGKVAHVTFSDANGRSGGAEQIALFTIYYAEHYPTMWGMGYVQSALRVLPQGIGWGMFQALRPQDILVQGAPVQFGQVGINLGAYFFAEAILNFGPFWSLGVGALAALGLSLVERTRERGVLQQLCYPVFAIMMPTLALYGSTNFAKQFMTILVPLLFMYAVGSLRRDSYRGSGSARAPRAAMAGQVR